MKIHRLVALAFIPNNDPLKVIVDHIDRDKTNNNVKNLRWVNFKQSSNNVTFKPHSSGRKVVQLDLDGNKIKIWPCIAEAARQLSIDKNGISNVCLGKTHKQKTAGGFLWEYVTEEIKEPETWIDVSDDVWLSDLGRLYYPYGKRYTRGTYAQSTGYYSVTLDGRKRPVHILVAEYFIPNPDWETKLIVNHLDGNGKNNHVNNLEWATYQRNTRHAVAIGRLKSKPQEYNGMSRPMGYFENGIMIRTFKSCTDAARDAGVALSTFKTYMAKENCSYKYIDGKIGRKGQSIRRKIAQYDRRGTLVATYETLMDAVRATGYARSTIQQKLKNTATFPHNDNFRYAD